MTEHSRFGEAEAKRIIGRAAEIDAQKPMDLKALREIASEAGISPAAVDKALAEHLEPPKPPLTARLLRRPGLLIGALLLLAFFLMRMFPQP
jgi:hypothetical protein